jgi:hypothetical protein
MDPKNTNMILIQRKDISDLNFETVVQDVCTARSLLLEIGRNHNFLSSEGTNLFKIIFHLLL